MKQLTAFTITCIFIFTNFSLTAQDSSVQAAPANPKYTISFKKEKNDTVHISQTKNTFAEVELSASNIDNAAFKEHKITVSVDKGDFPADKVEVITGIENKLIKDLKTKEGNIVLLQIKKEEGSFKLIKPVTITVTFKITDKDGKEDNAANNEGKIKEFKIIVQPFDEKLESYRYLGYLGTNFDLVDGVQAKNLFFATNIFIPETHKWGFSLSLYGNRSMTKTDTSKQTTFESRIEKINNDSIARYFDTALKVTTRVSDNIGATFIPLIPISCLSDGDLKFYYAPQFEFVWRRTSIENAYLNSKNIRIDSMKSRYPANTAFPLVTPLSTKVNFNVYDVYLGLAGILLRYENSDISIRINGSVGFNFNFIPLGSLSRNNTTSDADPVYPVYQKLKRYFFFGRVWITEPTTGLTLGSEISNYFGEREVNGMKVSKAQPYYNVTLSKAFNLKNLAAIVKPLTRQ